MAAPVVPVTLANAAPNASIPVLTAGVPTMLPRTRMPPEMTNKANSRMTKGRYSPSAVCSTSLAASTMP